MTVTESSTTVADSQPWWRKRPSKGVAIGVAALVLLVMLQLVESGDSSRPYDPSSTKPDGAKAFVQLMQEAGANVVQTNVPVGDTAVLLDDTLTQSETDRVEQWVADGGTLVVADVRSSFQRASIDFTGELPPSALAPKCSASYVKGVKTIEPEKDRHYYEFAPDSRAVQSCFPTDTRTYLQEHRSERGRIIELGGADIFTNDRIDELDNSVLITNMLQPSSDNPLTFLVTRDTASTESTGGATLSDLISPRVKDAAWMLIIAAILLVVWRSRRFGKPVEENALVRIPASQLTAATGDLLQTAGRTDAAVAMLRAELRRSLCDLIGLRVDTPTEAIAALAAERTGVDRQRVLSLLSNERITDPSAFVSFAQQVEDLHREVTHVR